MIDERMRNKLIKRRFRERVWLKLADGFSKRVGGGGIGKAITAVGLVGVGLAVFVCYRGGLGCDSFRKPDPPQPIGDDDA